MKKKIDISFPDIMPLPPGDGFYARYLSLKDEAINIIKNLSKRQGDERTLLRNLQANITELWGLYSHITTRLQHHAPCRDKLYDYKEKIEKLLTVRQKPSGKKYLPTLTESIQKFLPPKLTPLPKNYYNALLKAGYRSTIARLIKEKDFLKALYYINVLRNVYEDWADKDIEYHQDIVKIDAYKKKIARMYVKYSRKKFPHAKDMTLKDVDLLVVPSNVNRKTVLSKIRMVENDYIIKRAIKDKKIHIKRIDCKDQGTCVVRALSVVLKKSFEETYEVIFEAMMQRNYRSRYTPTMSIIKGLEPRWYHTILLGHGFKNRKFEARNHSLFNFLRAYENRLRGMVFVTTAEHVIAINFKPDGTFVIHESKNMIKHKKGVLNYIRDMRIEHFYYKKGRP